MKKVIAIAICFMVAAGMVYAKSWPERKGPNVFFEAVRLDSPQKIDAVLKEWRITAAKTYLPPTRYGRWNAICVDTDVKNQVFVIGSSVGAHSYGEAVESAMSILRCYGGQRIGTIEPVGVVVDDSHSGEVFNCLKVVGIK